MYNTSLYQHSPITLQEGLLAGRALLRGLLRERRRFWHVLDRIRQTQWWSEGELHDYQRERLRELLVHARRQVPFYARSPRQQNSSRASRVLPAALERFPILEKEDVLRAGEQLLARRYCGFRVSGGTGGTTGLSLKGYRDLRAVIYENAFIWRQLEWAGFRRGQRRAWIRGDMVVPVDQTSPPFWRRNRADNTLMMSSFHLSEESAMAYLKALEDFDPVLIQAYPSSISFLARYLKGRSDIYRGRGLRAIVTSSETLWVEDRQIVEQTFGCPVFDWYGCYEQVAAIGTCEKGRYHLVSDYSFVELHSRADGSAEMVGTCFYNRLMPFIRYRIGDAVVPAPPGVRCGCGRSFPVIDKILGRTDDAILTPDGRRLSMMINMFDGLYDVLQGQVVQDRLDEIRVRIVPARAFVERDIERVRQSARSLTGPAMNIVVEVVSDIPRTSNGKVRGVVCNIR